MSGDGAVLLEEGECHWVTIDDKQVCIGGTGSTAQYNVAEELAKLTYGAKPGEEELVARELSKLPLEQLKALKDRGVTVAVCHDSVTSYLENLKGVMPRGWPPGSTWDKVPGLYNTPTDEVVIALRPDLEGNYRVPPTGDAHGSYNMAIHETLHALDRASAYNGTYSSMENFTRPAQASLGGVDRLLNPLGAAYTKAQAVEMFAEIGARYYGGQQAEVEREMPQMASYFKSFKPLK